MDIRKFLTTEEKVAGVTISDSKISIAFLKSLSRGKGVVIENLKEISLPEGIIVEGLVKNKTALINAFKKLVLDFYLLKKKVPKILPAVLSFPSQKVYSQLFDFPDRITYDRLEESMKLTVGFSLPLKAEDCYLDWETISFEEKKVLLALIKKEIIDPYLEVFNKVSILPIACELHSLSLNRVISSFEENPFCLALINSQGIEVGISKEKTLRFMEGLYWKDHLSSVEIQNIEERKKVAERLILKTINFYQTDKTDSGFIEKIYLIGELSEISPFSKSLKEKLGKEVIISKIPFEIEVPKKAKRIKSKILKLTNLENEKKKELGDSEEKNIKKITEVKNKLAELKEQKEKTIKKLADLQIQKREILMVDTKEEIEKEQGKLKELKKEKASRIKELPDLEKQKTSKIRDLESEGKKEVKDIKIRTRELKKQNESATRRFSDLERRKEREIKDLRNKTKREIKETEAKFEKLDKYREELAKKLTILEEQRKKAENSGNEKKAVKINLKIEKEFKKQEDSISLMKTDLEKQKQKTESLIEQSEKAKNELLELKKQGENKTASSIATSLQDSENKVKRLKEEKEKIIQGFEELKKQRTAEIEELSKSEKEKEEKIKDLQNLAKKGTKEVKITINKIEKSRKQKELEIKNLFKLEKKEEKNLKDLENISGKTIEKLKICLKELQKSKEEEIEKISTFEIPQISQITNRFLVTFGAALRGLIPRAKDTFISLLPVGTEERYTKSRIVSLLSFVRNWAAVTALVLIVLFVGVYFLVNKFNSNIEEELANLQARSVTEELQKIKDKASEFNKSLLLMESLEKQIFGWSKLFEELDKNQVSGVIFTGLETKPFQKEIILKGIAGKREDLLVFRDNLIKSEFFTDVDIPTKILEKPEEVPFIVEFKIK